MFGTNDNITTHFKKWANMISIKEDKHNKRWMKKKVNKIECNSVKTSDDRKIIDRLINEDFTKIKEQILLIWNINYLKNKQYIYIMKKKQKLIYKKTSQIYVLCSETISR